MVYRGTRAVVNNKKCVGCGKCAITCPAGIIQIVKGEAPAL
ncbi:MAG: 4Fe-4S binding protein [Oscillospiraceae bacterium]